MHLGLTYFQSRKKAAIFNVSGPLVLWIGNYLSAKDTTNPSGFELGKVPDRPPPLALALPTLFMASQPAS